MLAYTLAKHNKPFSDAEFVKECMFDAVDITCPEVRTKIEAISLSRSTIVRRIGGIAQNLSEQLFEAGKSFEWYSLALDESTDIEDTAQLLVFIRGIDENLIRARGLNHRQFKCFLDDMESEYSDVLYHSKVRWLSLGNVLRRVWNLREEILLFLEMRQIDCEFSSEIKKPE